MLDGEADWTAEGRPAGPCVRQARQGVGGRRRPGEAAPRALLGGDLSGEKREAGGRARNVSWRRAAGALLAAARAGSSTHGPQLDRGAAGKLGRRSGDR